MTATIWSPTALQSFSSACAGALSIGPMMPRWLRVGRRNTGIAPVIVMACRIDLWQLRSTTTTSPAATLACHTTLLEVEVPLVTKKQ